MYRPMCAPCARQILPGRRGARKVYLSLALTAFMLCIALGACRRGAHLQGVRFRIVAEGTEEPLGNRELGIYRFVYDVPYDSQDVPWFITSVTTDEDGVFTLDLSDLDVGYVVVQPGQPYNVVRFERASDLQHTGSSDHIRVVRFKPGETRVESNAIYDLARQTVQIIPIEGGAWEEPFAEILLVAPVYEPSRSGK